MFDDSPKARRSTAPLIAAAGLALAALLVFGWLRTRPPADGVPESELTEEARAYLPQLELSDDTGMEAREDALGQTLLEITGTISNLGERVCTLVEVNVVFRDIHGIEIDRQRAAIVSRRTGPLPPGGSQPFRMAFDSTPLEWNQAFPNLFVSRIEFGR
jgi:hypothetical protein